MFKVQTERVQTNSGGPKEKKKGGGEREGPTKKNSAKFQNYCTLDACKLYNKISSLLDCSYIYIYCTRVWFDFVSNSDRPRPRKTGRRLGWSTNSVSLRDERRYRKMKKPHEERTHFPASEKRKKKKRKFFT
jgi:hypothetical protein